MQQRDGDGGGRAALPADQRVAVFACRSMVRVISLITARISCLRWLLLVAGASKTARTSAPARASQASSSLVSWPA